VLKNFFSRYKYYILTAIVVFVILTLLLIVFSGGPQKGGFNYQIF